MDPVRGVVGGAADFVAWSTGCRPNGFRSYMRPFVIYRQHEELAVALAQEAALANTKWCSREVDCVYLGH